MAAVIGLDEAPLREACAAALAGRLVTSRWPISTRPANLIVSGDARSARPRWAPWRERAGARRVLPLNVGGPFHSVYMRPAADAADHAPWPIWRHGAQRVPVVLNATARTDHRTRTTLRHELAVQVYSPVRWIETLQRLAALGCDRFVEVGPGNVARRSGTAYACPRRGSPASARSPTCDAVRSPLVEA